MAYLSVLSLSGQVGQQPMGSAGRGCGQAAGGQAATSQRARPRTHRQVAQPAARAATAASHSAWSAMRRSAVGVSLHEASSHSVTPAAQ